MKKPRWKHIRWIILALLLAGVCMFRFISGAGEFYACCIYNHRTTKTNQKYPSVNL